MNEANIKNLAQILEDSADRLPDKICLIYENSSFTYKALNKLVNRAGNAFLNLGIRKGDRVLISLLNTPEFVISFFALAKIGAITVPVNYMVSATTSWTEKCATTSWTKFFDNRIITTSFHEHQNQFGGVHGRGKQKKTDLSRGEIQ